MTIEDDEDWRLQAWMTHFGKRQADLANELGWTKNRAHFVWHSKQPYRRLEVNEIAQWLGIKPYELLMEPRDALALRKLREMAVMIASAEDQEAAAQEAKKRARARPRLTASR